MTSYYETPRLGLFLPLRLATYVIIMATVMIWMHNPQYLNFQVLLYSLVTLGFAVSMALEKKLRLHRITRWLIFCQFIVEISLESAIVYVTGNINSPFLALLVLSIVSASLVYRMVGTLLIASLVSFAFAFVIWLGLSRPGTDQFSVEAFRTIFSSNEAAFYGILLHILIFYLTAFISGYLADRLNSQVLQLQDTSSALRRARLETDDILRHLNSGLLTIDAEGRIIFFNRAAEKILGYGEDNVRGMLCEDVFSERMPELARCLMMGVTQRVSFPRREVQIVSLDRQLIPLGLSTSILTEGGQQIRGIIAIFSDLTEAKEMERKVRGNDRLAAVGELSASIAHEIRNPLAAISGSVEVLQSELHLEGENSRLMELITKESHRLNLILTDFLAYARMGQPAYQKIELCHIVSDVCELLRRHEASQSGVRLRYESDEAVAYVVGDEDLVRQLLMNLGINACEALRGLSGDVVVGVNRDSDGRRVCLTVADNGPGIDPEALPRIYEPFFSTKKGGTGLGLAIVHRICNNLNLRLSVDTRPGEGTRFCIDFTAYGRIGNAGNRSERSDTPLAVPTA
jgi:two-component system sensor histidine kinase PilS (NtrC family)